MTAERLGQLRDQQEQAWDMVHASRYRELAPLVASLIPELEQAVRASAAPELTEAVRELLTDTYQAVAAMMAKLGETDAAWIAADRAAFAAEMMHDQLAVAASLFRMADVFLTLRQTGQVQAVASAAIRGLEQQAAGTPTTETLSLCGAFHLVLAIAERATMTAHRDMSTWTRPGRSPSASAWTATTSAPSSVPPTWPCMLWQWPSSWATPGKPWTSPTASMPQGCRQKGKHGTTSTSPRHTPCDGRSAKPCAASKKPSGSPRADADAPGRASSRP